MPQYSKTTWVDGTAPAISAANLNKLEQGVFDSLRQDGSTTMSAQLVTIAGTAATPAIAPTGDSNTGIFFPAADTIAFGEGGTEVMRINSSGNVGIGIDTPNSKLHLYQNNTNPQYITISNATSTYLIGNDASGNFTHYTNQAKGYNWATSGTTKMVITDTGNVGIGTTSPASKLEVSGLITRTVTVDGSTGSPAEESGIQYRHPVSASNRAGINFFNTYANNGAAWLSFLTTNTSNSYAERMRIDAAGNVGIGTISPNYKLEVAGTGAFTGASGIGAIRVSGAGGSWFWIDNDATTRMRFSSGGTAGTNPMYFTDGGFLGIGVVPNAELHIKGTGEIMRLETTAATGDNFIRFYAPSSATKGFIGYTSSGNDHLNINNVLSADLLFHTNNIERLRIESGGTTRPAANNTYDLGNSSFRWATIYAQNALNTSDARLKTDIEESSLGLDFVNSLNPVQFRYIEGGNTVERVQTGTETVEISPSIPAQPEVPEIVDEDGNVIQEYVAAVDEVPAVTEERPTFETVVTPREGVRTHFGLLAQEVKAALPDGLDFAGWALADKEDAESTQFLGYAELIAPMIKAIQELNAKVEALEAQIAK